MNERIEKLAEQAKCYADENNAHYLQNPHWIETFEEKFAELIVKECAELAKHHVMNISTYADAEFVDQQIMKHFGVEE